MPVRISFDTGNAAFDFPGGPHEAARILRALADSLDQGSANGKVFDLNGNSIGKFSATFRKEGR